MFESFEKIKVYLLFPMPFTRISIDKKGVGPRQIRLDVIYVASNQTFASNKTFILWTLINSDKRSAVSGSWNPGTNTLNREGAVSTWH